MQRIFISCLSLLLVLLMGCAFHPNEDDNFKVVDSTVVFNPVRISLENAGDTIPVFGRVEFEYEIQGLDNGKPYEIYFIVQSTGGGNGLNSLKGTFTYAPQKPTGYETLKLQVLQPSGTGSLADKIGVEKIIYERSWVLEIDTSDPVPWQISSIHAAEGSLKLGWPRYVLKNFKAYRILKLVDNTTRTFTINDRNTNSFYDSSFVGRKTSYQLIIVGENDQISLGQLKDFEDTSVPKIVQYESRGDKMNVRISGSRYSDNVARYELYEGNPENNAKKLIDSSNGAQDTLFQIPSKFGQEVDLYVRTIPVEKDKNFEGTDQVESLPQKIVYGEKLHSYEKILFAPAYDRVFVMEGNRLYMFTISGNESVAELQLPGNGALAVNDTQDRVSLLYNNKLYTWSSLELSFEGEEDLSGLVTAQEPYLFGLGFIPGDQLALSRSVDSDRMGSLLICDLKTKALLETYSLFGTVENIEVRGDKVLSRHASGFYRFQLIEQGYPNLIAAIVEDLIYFDPENSNQVIHDNPSNNSTSGGVYFRDITARKDVNKIETPSMVTLAMEVNEGLVAGSMNNNSFVYDYKNGKIIWSGRLSDARITLKGKYMYSALGVRVKILE